MRKLLNEELDRLDVDAYKNSDKTPITIVLDNIRSLNNIGSVFRTADCYRIEKIILCGITAQPPHRDIRKTALGATESIEWEYVEDTLKALENLKNNQYHLCAIEQAENSTSLYHFKPEKGQKLAVVFGNEVKGVQQQVVDYCDTIIELQQFGTKHSLNISVCAGIVIYDLFNKVSSLRS
ncbi:RNA methyltransferase [Nonlabens tegetincola]|uniref:RNA methyltransferase n=1 Tax=Nonlabens tegetincola TaxID=323273 RepID=UPI000A203A56|nr:RNA methyltransferase [Nonlabens tegetincola]ARN72050.1 RNA methyltransferase [Nonlabens tegetincola]